jgi:hypothetical protein
MRATRCVPQYRFVPGKLTEPQIPPKWEARKPRFEAWAQRMIGVEEAFPGMEKVAGEAINFLFYKYLPLPPGIGPSIGRVQDGQDRAPLRALADLTRSRQ